MGSKKPDALSLIFLLFPFFGIWVLFWCVPIFMGFDLAFQNPERSVSHWNDLEIKSSSSIKPSFSWLDNKITEDNSEQDSKYVGFDNFKDVLSDPKFYKAIQNTFFYVLGSLLFILPIAFLLSVTLFQFSRLIRGFFVFSLMIPGLALPGVLSTLFYLFFHGKMGALNQYIVMPLGFDPINWMMDPDFILPSLIFQSVWRWTGLVTLFFLCGIEAIPRWQFEIAKIEGIGRLTKLAQIYLPNLWHLGVFAAVFLIVDGFASFSGAYNLLGGSGGIMDAGLLLVTYVYQVAFPGGSGQFNFPGAAAMSLLVVPATALFLFILLQNRQRLWAR